MDKADKFRYAIMHHPASLFLMLIPVWLILCFGCRRKKEKPLAMVNGEEIRAADFIEFYKSRPRVMDWTSSSGRLDPNEVLGALVDKLLMEQQAKKMGFHESPFLGDQLKKFEEKALVNIFIEKNFDPQVHVTDEEALADIPDYQRKEVRFATIAILDEGAAWEIKKKLDQGEDFSVIARSRSIGMNAEKGGVGDFLSPHRGIYPKKVIETIFQLPMGEVSTPQKIREGYGLFKPMEERPLNAAEMEQIMQYHRSLLSREKKNTLIREMLERIKKERKVAIHHEIIRQMASQTGMDPNPVLAEGEGIQILWNDLKSGLPGSVGEGKKGLWEDPNLVASILESRLNKQIMVLEAKRSGFEQNPDFTKEMQRFKQDLLARQLMIHEVERKLVVSEEECRIYYQENPALFSEPEMVRAKHILLKDKGKALEILSRLKKGDDFAALAGKYSAYKITSGKGGDMGYIRFGESGMGEEFDKAAFSLQTGQISELVETPFGYQIITIAGRKPGRGIPYEEVRDKIRQDLINQKRKNSFDAYLKSLRTEAKITINRDVFLKLSHDLSETGS